jgi:hypothetical protein
MTEFDIDRFWPVVNAIASGRERAQIMRVYTWLSPGDYEASAAYYRSAKGRDRNSHKLWTREDIERLRAWVRAGLSRPQMSPLLGRSTYAIWCKMRELGLLPKRPRKRAA